MTEQPVTVVIVDDDQSFRGFLVRLIESVRMKTAAFASAEEFLRARLPETAACLIVDVQMPGLSGLDLQRELKNSGHELPMIFITGHGDIPMSVQAMKAGAVSFLSKPLRNQDLLDAVREAINMNSEARRRRTEVAGLRARYESLTAREREVFALVATGLLNKQIALQLGTTERTVKAHRGQMVQKMQADSVAHLVRMADKLGIASSQ
jgi:FixJ family two-component response regulator